MQADNFTDLLDFAARQSCPAGVRSVRNPDKKQDRYFLQCVLSLLLQSSPDGMAVDVPLGRSKFPVSVAAWWREQHSRNLSRIASTAAVVICKDISCIIGDSEETARRLRFFEKLLTRKIELEKFIEKTEPELAEADDLFEDLRTWNYSASSNSEYREVCRELENERRFLKSVSKLERLRRLQMVDHCYLALPASLIDSVHLPDDVGVIALPEKEGGAEIIRPPQLQPGVNAAGRNLLALNISAASLPEVCFANGVDKSGKIRPIPRRRRKRVEKLPPSAKKS